MSQVLQDCLQSAIVNTGVKPASGKGILLPWLPHQLSIM